MSKISNVILMLQYLSNGKKYSIKELSEKLEVTPRMVRVYKEELEKAGIFIDSIMGPYGGYVLNQEIVINKEKINATLTPEDQYKYNILTRAIKEKRKVKLLYTSKSHGDNYRVIDPTGMYVYKDGWYCVAYCELREDMRQFGLKDIKEIELLDEYF